MSNRIAHAAPFVALVLSLAVAPGALAAKGGKSAAATGLTLSSQYVSNSPNPAAPTWCLNEDDWHQRNWSGSLNGSFTATEQLCDGSVDYAGGTWWNAGGIGLQSDLYVTGTLSDLAITSPQGLGHHAVLVGSSTSRGLTTNHYQVCYVPPYSTTSGTGGTPLAGGSWQISLTGDVTNVRYTVDAEMTDIMFQQQHCPASEQNLVP